MPPFNQIGRRSSRCARLIALLATIGLLISACSSETHDDDTVHVVSSFSIITDIAEQLGGDHVDVHNLVLLGTDPHEYEPKPEDLKRASDADLLIFNGLNLEGGEHGWFSKLVDSVRQDPDRLIEASHGVKPLTITDSDERTEEINPHAFISPLVGQKMTENIRDGLIQVDPEHRDDYQRNAEVYLRELRDIDDEYREKIESIPEKDRYLVTSERAFQYLANQYGLKEGWIWAIDTEENGSPEQIKKAISFVQDNDVPTLFVESNVDLRPMETVSQETDTPIGGTLYSDEIGNPGSDASTYTDYLRYNIRTIHEGITTTGH